jgi:hypothetical protein
MNLLAEFKGWCPEEELMFLCTTKAYVEVGEIPCRSVPLSRYCDRAKERG